MPQQVGNHVHRPAVSQHFICLGIAYREYVGIRHGLEAFALGHCQLADNVVTICQLDRILLVLNGDETVLHLIKWIGLAVPELTNQPALVPSDYGIRFPITADFPTLVSFVPTASNSTTRHSIKPRLSSHAAVSAQGHDLALRGIHPVLLAIVFRVGGVALNGANTNRLGNHVSLVSLYAILWRCHPASGR